MNTPYFFVGRSLLRFALLGLMLSLGLSASAQTLIHRYSFDEDASDLVGDAHGELVGSATIADKSVVLSGTAPSYVNLPNDLVLTLTSASFEAWVTWNGGAVWQRIWDFGNNNNTEDLQGTGTQSIFLTPNNGGGMVLSIFPNQIGTQQVLSAPALPIGGLHQVVWTYDAAATTGRLYVDGKQVAVNTHMTHTPASLGSTVNNWLGHSQYPDADFNGKIAEFRIYDAALSATQVAAHFTTGPDPDGRGNLVALHLVARESMRPGTTQQARVLADFQNVTEVDVTTDPTLTFESGDTAVFTVSATGLVSAGGGGTANLTARWQGKSTTLPIQVIPAAPALLIHRYSFNTNADDLIGNAHAELIGDATIAEGAVVLSGNKPSYVNLPNGIFGALTNVTFEFWTIWRGGGAWQRLFDFGNSSQGEDVQGAATQGIFLTPNNGGGMQLSIFPEGLGGQQAIGAAGLGPDVLRHVVFTYDALAHEGRLFVDGVQVGLNANMTYTLSGVGEALNNWLGHSQYTQDADYKGSIAEFRVYDGALTPAEVADHSVVGPGPSGRGNLLAVRLLGQEIMLQGVTQQLQVEADFENVAGVNITSDPAVTFESGNSGVLAVANDGQATAATSASGPANITARFSGKSATRTFQVIAPVTPVLWHRYGFAADASDSVGDAHGELVGSEVANGSVVLTGTKPCYVNLPNDLFTNLTDVTLEVWVTWAGGGPWQRIWDFGNSNLGEDSQGEATFTQSVFFTPDNGGGMVLSIFPNGIANQQVVSGPALGTGQQHHVVWTYSAAARTALLYVDGAQVGINTAMTHTLAGLGSTVNNWLGHSQYVWDADFAGSIAEFRIFSGTFLPADVMASEEAGPDSLPSEANAWLLAVALSGNNLVISWPVGTTLTLEASTQLGATAAWAPLGIAPVVVEGRNQVTVPMTGETRYFRPERN